MTIKRTWTQKLPFIGIEVPRSKVLNPGHKEEVWVGMGGGYEGPDEWKSWVRSYYDFEVLSQDEMLIRHYSYGDSTTTSERILVREQINNYFAGEIRHKDGKTIYRFNWEPTLPSQARK